MSLFCRAILKYCLTLRECFFAFEIHVRRLILVSSVCAHIVHKQHQSSHLMIFLLQSKDTLHKENPLLSYFCGIIVQVFCSNSNRAYNVAVVKDYFSNHNI